MALSCVVGCGRIGYEPGDADLLPASGPTSEAHPTSAEGGPRIAVPAVGASWQIQLTGTVDTSLDASFFVVDLDVTAQVLTELHAAGRFVACYFSGGTWESFRADASSFPSATLGNAVTGYPRERWVDVRSADVRTILAARVAAAAQRGCDGIQASSLSAFTEDTGFALTRADQLDYDRWLAAAAHARGLAIGLEDGDVTLAQDLVADFDWTVVWDCLDTTCSHAPPFTDLGKPGFLVSTGDGSQASSVCAAGARMGLSTIIKKSSLDGFRVGCP